MVQRTGIHVKFKVLPSLGTFSRIYPSFFFSFGVFTGKFFPEEEVLTPPVRNPLCGHYPHDFVLTTKFELVVGPVCDQCIC